MLRFFSFVLFVLPFCIFSQESVSFSMLTNDIILIHFDEGYIQHATNGQTNDQAQVFRNQLNTSQIITSNFSISSTSDANYSTGVNPSNVYRKTKPMDYADFCETWQFIPYYGVFGCVNNEDHIDEHWIYLKLSTPLIEGNTYSINFTNSAFPTALTYNLDYSTNTNISQAIHINNTGYSTNAPEKFGYIYQWIGDGGALELASYIGKNFYLIEENSNSVAFTGTVSFRANQNLIETYQGETEGTLNQNFNGTFVYDCNFSNFNQVGTYRLKIEDMGISNPFQISCNVLRKPFEAVMKGIFQNRSGIEIDNPFSESLRPTPHNPILTPGFAGRLKYTSTTWCEVSESDASLDDKALWDAGIQGDLTDSWGWYQDAGDWDGYLRHFEVPAKLLFLYEHQKENFADSQLSIVESGDGIPDILNESRWLIRFMKRVKDETFTKGWTTGGVPGSRIFGDLWGNDLGTDDKIRGSWQDNDRTWVVSGEDMNMTYIFAGLAAQFAFLMERDGYTDPENIDWEQEAIDAFAWAELQYDPNYTCHEIDVKWLKNFASAALYRLTETANYNTQFVNSWNDTGITVSDEFNGYNAFGGYIYAFTNLAKNTSINNQISTLIENTADFNLLNIGNIRACRWGGNPYFPMLVGQPTTPLIFEGYMGYNFLKNTNPTKAESYLTVLHNTSDYFLGNNPLGITWISGYDEHSPTNLLHLDSWATGNGDTKTGYVPYGPWRKTGYNVMGPFHHEWPHQWVYPAIDLWPGHERWFAQRFTALGPEFTIDQNNVNAAAIYGALSGDYTCSDIINEAQLELVPVDHVIIYPNPFNDSFRIKGELDKYDLTIVNQTGQTVMYLPNVGNNFDINTSNLGSGIYFIQVVSDNGAIFLKHIVKM